jgi:hypothetical protein
MYDNVNNDQDQRQRTRVSALQRVLAGPGFRDCSAGCDVVDDQDQLVIVVAVEDFDVDAGLGHAAGDLAELTRFGLVQSLD